MNDKKRTMVIGVQTFSNILVKQQTEIILRKSAQLRRCKRSAPVSLYKPEDWMMYLSNCEMALNLILFSNDANSCLWNGSAIQMT